MQKYSLNQVILIGRLGQNPEIRKTKTDITVANMSLATSSSKKSGDQYIDETEWHKLTAFGKTAEFVQKHGSKGRLCYIVGRLQTRKYTSEDGVTRYTTSIIVDQFQFLDKKDSHLGSGQPGSAPAPVASSGMGEAVMPQNEEELPF